MEWIKTSEMQPPENSKVLIIVDGWCYGATIALYEYGMYKALNGYHGYEPFAYVNKPQVLYWMPLPEPPIK